MCAVLKVSRSGFYAWLKREESARAREDRELLERIKEIHEKSRGTYGSPRVQQELIAQGVKCGRNRVARLMKEAGIQATIRRKFRVTTDSAHSHPVAPNLLAQDFTADAPDRVWVGDITYISTDEGWLYLASILDLFSRKVVGWSMGSRIQTALVLDALRMAVGRRAPAPGLIFHSDRGSQYASVGYQNELRKNGMICSMSGKGNWRCSARRCGGAAAFHPRPLQGALDRRFPARPLQQHSSYTGGARVRCRASRRRPSVS